MNSKLRLIIFYQFLKEKGIVTSYVTHLKKRFRDERIVIIFLRKSCENLHGWTTLISSAFAWQLTNEGEYFWRNIAFEWLKVINDKKI